jgi:parvulin-like peptidyl-prolyl isomerase
MVMLLESEPQAIEVRAKLEKGESFTELAEELSLDYFSKTNQGDYGWHIREILSELLPADIVEYAFNSEAGVLSQPIYDEEMSKGVGYWLARVLDRNEEEEAHVQVMLLGSEAKAQEVRSRLETGEDFATLAKEFSQLEGVEENEGEYMVSPGMMTPAVEELVFDPETELETISEPIRDETVSTVGAYWLIKVVAKDENRRIEKDDRDLLKSKAFDQWVSSLWDDPENEVDDSYLDAEQKAWAMEQATRG